ncbi:MAG: co-chaperone GroES [archaeon]
MRIKPIGERVILKQTESKEERTASGIYLPKSEDKKEGIVEEVGTLKDGSLIPLMKGDKVIYGGYSSEEIEVEGQKFLIVEFKDIVAKIEGGMQ